MNQSPKDARIAARIPPAVKETLQKAADLSGATLNQFLVQAALKEAHQILETETNDRFIRAGCSDSLRFIRKSARTH